MAALATPNLPELVTLREFPRGSLTAQPSADGVLTVSGAQALIGTSANARRRDETRPDFAAMKAARRVAIAAAHAAVDFGALLCGFSVQTRRPESLAWLRATPVELWPPIRVTLCDDGSPALTDGHHRVAVARELGVGLPALVRTVAGVAEGLCASLLTGRSRIKNRLCHLDQALQETLVDTLIGLVRTQLYEAVRRIVRQRVRHHVSAE